MKKGSKKHGFDRLDRFDPPGMPKFLSTPGSAQAFSDIKPIKPIKRIKTI
jgi:hypothetical protein